MKRWISGQVRKGNSRLQVGEIVKDRTGAHFGSIESVAEAEPSPMVVIKDRWQADQRAAIHLDVKRRECEQISNQG